MNEELKLLTLGEGDFSFSLSFCKMLRRDPANATSIFNHFLKENKDDLYIPKINLTATSYDSINELPDKYPYCNQILDQLNSFHNVKVLHRVNAWELDNFFPKQSFDAILWNHPHLGVESFKLHKYLLSHFLHNSQKVMKPAGCIIISLIEGQAERWQLIEQARKHDLELFIKKLFEVKEWPGYTTRRNRNGKSFTNAHTQKITGSDMKSYLYLFIRSADKNYIPLGFKGLTKSILSQDLDGEKVPITLDPTRIIGPLTNISFEEKDEQLYPQKNTRAYHNFTNKESINKEKTHIELKCEICSKKFHSNQGLDTHVRQVHIYKKYGSNWIPDRPKIVECPGCSKRFPDKEAMWQHSISIHKQVPEITSNDLSNNTPSKPENGALLNKNFHTDYNYESEIAPLIDHYSYYPCPVCGLAVPEKWGITQHLETLKPILNLKLRCEICNKEFIETRALIQHWKFCFEKSQKQELIA